MGKITIRQPKKPADARHILRHHLILFQTAIRDQDVAALMDLIYSVDGDIKLTSEFFSKYANVKITTTNGHFQCSKRISGAVHFQAPDYEFGNLFRIWLVKNLQSPTGWKIKKLKFLKDKVALGVKVQ